MTQSYGYRVVNSELLARLHTCSLNPEPVDCSSWVVVKSAVRFDLDTERHGCLGQGSLAMLSGKWFHGRQYRPVQYAIVRFGPMIS